MRVKKTLAPGLWLSLFAAFALVQAPEAMGADTRLADAAMNGDTAAVRALLQQKADVTGRQGDGSTALHWAAYRDDAAMVRALLAAGADIKAKTRVGDITPLFMSAKNGNAEVLGLMLKAGADVNSTDAVGTTPLMLAAASGKIDGVKVLLDAGAKVNVKDLNTEQSPLMFAAAFGRASIVKLLIERGAELNAVSKVSEVMPREARRTEGGAPGRRGRGMPDRMGGMTALHLAAREGHLEAVRELVAAGADINKPNAADRMSILTTAIINGKLDVAMFLLEKGADPNIANQFGIAPLWATVDAQWAERTWYPAPSLSEQKTNHLDLLKALLERGADPNAKLLRKPWYRTMHGDWANPAGATAFWLAAKANDVAAMKILVAGGANPALRGDDGVPPLQIAAGWGLEPQVTNFAPDQRVAALRYLVEELNADVNSRDKKGYTPLHGAALTANNAAILYLVSAGADVTARANMVFGADATGQGDKDVSEYSGDTVADMANGPKAHNLVHPETVALLEKMGSKNSNFCRAATCVVIAPTKDK